MAGLLDFLDNDQGLLGLALMSAGSAKPVRTGLGEGLMYGLWAVNKARGEREDRLSKKQMQDMQMQSLLAQIEETKAQAAQRMAGVEAQKQKAAETAALDQRRSGYLGSLDASAGPAREFSLPQALSSGLSLQEALALAPKPVDPMAGIDKVSPKDYTPESFAQFVAKRNPAVLRAAPKNRLGFINAFASTPPDMMRPLPGWRLL